MKLLIDDANIQKIKELLEYYPLDGVTTNPSILSKYNEEPFVLLKKIRAIIGYDSDLHVQVTALKAEEMVLDALKIVEVLGDKTIVKVPAIKEGFKAMKELKKKGIKVTATAIYSSSQALMAMKCGADYVAPYVNRVDNLGGDGLKLCEDIQDMIDIYGYDAKILGASFKRCEQVLKLAEYGIAACTCNPELIESLIKNDDVDKAVAKFVSDFKLLVGDDKTMKDLL